jgi:hypothetical protein
VVNHGEANIQQSLVLPEMGGISSNKKLEVYDWAEATLSTNTAILCHGTTGR